MTPPKIQRELETISETEKIRKILKNHLLGKTLFLKQTDPHAEIKLLEFASESKNEIWITPVGTRLEKGPIALFRILGRYIELHCTVLEGDPDSSRYRIRINEAAIAKKERKHLRISVQESLVYVTNIRTSKQSIDATLFNIPTSVKVNFSMFEQKLKPRADFVKIDVFGDRGTILDEVRKTGKALLVEDTHAISSYTPRSDEFVDYASFLGINITKAMNDYKLKKVISEMIIPVNYITHDEDVIPLGYIQLQSKSHHFTREDVVKMKKVAEELVKTIRDSNTVYIQEKQRVLNLSRGGMKMLITHDELKNYLIRQRGFTFDLVFKMQAPITLYGIIRSAARDGAGNLLLGIQISGYSSRENEMKRFMDNVNLMENKLKEKVARQTETLKGKSQPE